MKLRIALKLHKRATDGTSRPYMRQSTLRRAMRRLRVLNRMLARVVEAAK